MEPRVTNMARFARRGIPSFLEVENALHASPLPKTVQELVKLRVSQINGCAFCVDMHAHDAKDAGETDERLYAVAVWREAPFFTPAERAALALAEAATRISDRPEPVSDDVWEAARDQYDDEQLGDLVTCIATINAWNRLNVVTRQPAGNLPR